MKQWSEIEIAKAISMIKDYKTFEEMSQELIDRSPRSIRVKLSKLGYSRLDYSIHASNCKSCKQLFESYRYEKRQYCSSSCANKVNSTNIRRHGSSPNICKFCNKPTSSSRNKYCSKKCKGSHANQLSWDSGNRTSSVIRMYLLRTRLIHQRTPKAIHT
jgi:hypothetical protein